jgi:uncharacterized membrane protein
MGGAVRFAVDLWTTGIARRALIVALVVGTTLNCINQGDAVLHGAPVNLGKLALTYIVPFLVSAHGALTARKAQAR